MVSNRKARSRHRARVLKAWREGVGLDFLAGLLVGLIAMWAILGGC